MNKYWVGERFNEHTLFTPNKEVPWHTVIMRTVGPAICFNTGGAGGIFAPSLAAGASVGAFFSTYSPKRCKCQHYYIKWHGWLFNWRYPNSIYFGNPGVGNDRQAQRYFSPDAGRNGFEHRCLLIDKRSLYEHLKESYIKEIFLTKKNKSQAFFATI